MRGTSMIVRARLLAALACVLVAACSRPGQSKNAKYDVVIRNGLVYDGTGIAPKSADIAINRDTIVKVGNLNGDVGRLDVDAQGLAVAPGFINMLSQATDSLIEDGKSQSDIRQGVTVEIFGEGDSMGPLNDALKKVMRDQQGDIKYRITWTTLAQYLSYLEKRGVSTNVASFVGAATVRENVLGFTDRAPSPQELDQMKQLVAQAMRDGALGVGSALIYAPGFYAKTDELTALAQVAAQYGGMYISHIRSEGNGLLPAIDELISIAAQAHCPAEIFHLKEAGQANWSKLPEVIEKVEKARREGLAITADMYTYTAGATGLDASMPPWVQEGGLEAWRKRLQDPATREKVKLEMVTPTDKWESLFLAAGKPENILLTGFKSSKLKPLTGKTLAEVAKMRNKSPEDTAIDLVIEDDSRVETIYFIINEANVKKQIALPWVAFGSDAESSAPEGVFLKSSTHPRAYGNFARLLGKYVRDEKTIPLQEAIRRLTAFPATNLKLDRRGELREGFFADVVVFDRDKIQDHATYANPRQFATGVVHVFVNGKQVLKDGEHTGAKPGRALKRTVS
jgi:N-acyl-D-amino-acid deacylase